MRSVSVRIEFEEYDPDGMAEAFLGAPLLRGPFRDGDCHEEYGLRCDEMCLPYSGCKTERGRSAA